MGKAIAHRSRAPYNAPYMSRLLALHVNIRLS